MRKKLLLILLGLTVSVSGLLFSTNELTGDTSGPNAGKCGAPSDNYTNCTSCHNGSTTTATGWITSDIPASGYIPGTTYTVTATATYSGLVRFGFQISPQNTSGVKLGTLVLTNTTTTQLVGSSHYVEHKTAGTTGTTGYHTWTFNWIAPVAGSGALNFYGAFNCANNNGSESGDHIYNSILSVIEGGCSISTTVTANGPTTFCVGSSVTLDAGSGFSAYQWSNNATTQTITVSTAGNYSVTVTSSGGCTASATSPTIIVNPLPATPVITPSGATTFCQGGSVTLSATTGLASYHWSTGASTQTINVTSSGSYIVTVTNANGCQAVSTATSVVVNPLPSTPVITPSGATTFCQGGSVTLSATSGLSTYHWSTGATTQSINVATTGSYTVTVTNANGCSAISAATQVTVNPLPTPVISGSTTICAGSSTVLNAGTGYSSYHWSTNETTQTITVSSANTYSVTVTNASGCSGNTSITVTVGSGLSPTITGSNTICNGGSSILNAGSGYTTYHWSTNATTQTITVTSANVYSVTVTNSSGCSGSASVTVTVGSSPTPVISGNTTICSGSTTVLNAGAGYSTYLWSTNATTQTITVSAANSYSVTVTNATGCSGSASVTVTVGSGITPTITGTPAICAGASTVLNAGSGYSSYHWSTNATTQNISVSAANTYSVTVTNASGCSGSASVTVTVSVAPAPNITGLSTICGIANIILHGGAGFSSYHWSTGATSQNIWINSPNTYYITVTNSSGCSGTDSKTVSAGTVPTPIISSSGSTVFCQGNLDTLNADIGFSNYNWSNGATSQFISMNTSGIYAVVVSNASGCTGSSDSITVTVNDTPNCYAMVHPSTICSGDAVWATADGDSSWAYTWNPGNVTGMSTYLIPDSSLTYILTATNAANCITSVALPVTVYPLPFTPAIIQSGGQLVALSNGAITYQWYLNGIAINGATNMTYIPIQSGNYSVIISNSYGCEKQSIPFGFFGDGISTLNKSGLTVYPNPFSEFISVQNLDERSEVEIQDVQGKVIFSKTAFEKNESFDTSELPSGIYLLKIKTENKIINTVMVKN